MEFGFSCANISATKSRVSPNGGGIRQPRARQPWVATSKCQLALKGRDSHDSTTIYNSRNLARLGLSADAVARHQGGVLKGHASKPIFGFLLDACRFQRSADDLRAGIDSSLRNSYHMLGIGEEDDLCRDRTSDRWTPLIVYVTIRRETSDIRDKNQRRKANANVQPRTEICLRDNRATDGLTDSQSLLHGVPFHLNQSWIAGREFLGKQKLPAIVGHAVHSTPVSGWPPMDAVNPSHCGSQSSQTRSSQDCRTNAA